ncbi:hypothetical protein Q73_15475 [Bacillus coahuilensis m2-6]|uniref:DUF6194 family protein n=1 Tax=Bacillus coahuilensis TaxID=408580 RepID=UPI00018506C6|nr:DUF6194 family protein [Bacillus coahuilensis]KUP04524.1 hypothetical protein Q73_15475 [Bacillus coahuilensis m2-6]
MKPKDIIQYVLQSYEGTVRHPNWGELGIFYNPEDKLTKGVYILTIKLKDGPNDQASNLNSDGVYRLNVAIEKDTFVKKFGSIPKRPLAGQTIEMDVNFAATDEIIPHPVYGWMSWISVINPSEQTFEQLKALIDEGYHLAVTKYKKKKI